MSFLQSSFARALQKSRLMNKFVSNAGKISCVLGLSAAVLLTVNRSVMSGEPDIDKMTLSGAALLASSLVLMPADKWPVLKRASGGLGLLYISLLMADAWGKPGAAGLAANCALATVACMSMLFERNSPSEVVPVIKVPEKNNALQRSWLNAVDKFKEAPVFWTSVVSASLKPFAMAYGIANNEALFMPYSIICLLETMSVGLMDNKVRRFFGVGITDPQKKSPVP